MRPIVMAFMLSSLFLPSALAAQQDTTRTVPDTARYRHEAVIVESTRTGGRLEDQPLRVEVVGREEIEEKLLMTPGDISMLLNETGGVRVQATAPGSGAAAVRIHGLRGHYSTILADGLPLYGEATGLGALQVPPMDLGSVEVIKGAASALYGAAALGGVINLVSRRPDGERELLLNATTRGGYDAVLWAASEPDRRVGWTIMGGGHTQARTDVSGDGWADIPGYDRLLLRPRAFIDAGRWRIMATAGFMTEQRSGGLPGVAGRDAVATDRLDAGMVAGAWLGSVRVTGRASALRQAHDRTFAGRRERDELRGGFAELAASGARGRHTWVLGAALQHDDYRSRDVPGFNERMTVPSIFVQDEWRPGDVLAFSASARLDHAGEFGTLVSPRLSLLLRPGEWNLRLSGGGGYHLPSHWIDDVHAIGLGALAAPSELGVERARSLSMDVGREFGEVELNVTVFGSHIEDALALRTTPEGPVVANVPGSTRTRGAELLVGAHVDPVHVRFTWNHTRATEPDQAGGRQAVELIPDHSAGFVAMWEPDDVPARVGFEAYYTGQQVLRDNPWRDSSRPFAVFGVLAERQFGIVRLFVNFENIGNVRQTSWDPLLLPQRAADGRRTTEAWAPLDGRVINGGVRLSF